MTENSNNKNPNQGKSNPLSPHKEDDRHRNRSLIIGTVTTAFSGPLPHPDILERYNRLVPNAAERILTMAEAEQKRRHHLETQIVSARSHVSVASLYVAFFVVMAALIGGIVLVIKDKGISGFGVIIAGLAPIVSAFVYNEYKKSHPTRD